MLENGFVKIHRSLLNWEWYHDKNTCRLFLHLILTVNYEDKKWQGQVIERGQRVASFSTLASETDMTIQEVRTALKHLIATGEITSTPCPLYSVISINNYDKYQEVTCSTTNDQQTPNIRLTNDQHTPNNNERKIKKDKESKKDKKDKEYKEKLSFDNVPSELLDDVIAYTEHRKEINAPMSQRALTLLINELNRLTSDINEQKEILNQSILNGWKGVFPLKKGDKTNDNTRNNGTTGQKADDDFKFSTVINYDE